MSRWSERFHERKVNVHNAYASYKNGGVDEEKVKQHIELLMHMTWQRRGKND